MARKTFLGEFEQMVLLAILQSGENANAYEIRKELEQSAGRTVSKGAFYTTLDRLEKKNYLSWKLKPAEQGRGGLPQRHFKVSRAGLRELRRSRDALVTLWRDGVLESQ